MLRVLITRNQLGIKKIILALDFINNKCPVLNAKFPIYIHIYYFIDTFLNSNKIDSNM